MHACLRSRRVEPPNLVEHLFSERPLLMAGAHLEKRSQLSPSFLKKKTAGRRTSNGFPTSVNMGSVETKVAIGILFGLLGLITLLLLCQSVKRIKQRRELSQEMAPAKPQVIQMALLNATAASFQPILVSTISTLSWQNNFRSNYICR